jgi:hypothetical protein
MRLSLFLAARAESDQAPSPSPVNACISRAIPCPGGLVWQRLIGGLVVWMGILVLGARMQHDVVAGLKCHILGFFKHYRLGF